MENSEVFARIYRNRFWGDGSDEVPLSGSGSNPDLATPYVDFVKEIIESLQISHVLDFGHGDWKMWRDYRFENVDYLGIDVVNELSQKLNLDYGRKGRIFRSEQDSDFLESVHKLLICKDVLQHLSNSRIIHYLNKFSSFQYLVICNDLYVKPKFYSRFKGLILDFSFEHLFRFSEFRSRVNQNNSNIEDGEFRGIDLQGPLFESALEKFQIVKFFDFHAPKRYGLVKRVYFLRRLSPLDNF